MNARTRADEFLKIADQFKLGSLVTESPHPVTMNLSEVASDSIPDALRMLLDVDLDVIRKYREWVSTDAPARIAKSALDALLAGGRIFFTGCGSTGRLSILLDSIWRDFWQGEAQQFPDQAEKCRDYEDRTCSVMAGGDFALIKSVEGFEDFTAFGARQIADMGVGPRDVVFAITEGGETSFVIGTAWKALEAGAKVYFVYNNPDEVLRATVERSREVIDEPRIEKINLTTGPMAITGSTRMQATTIQLCVMLTILEMALRQLWATVDPHAVTRPVHEVPEQFAAKIEEMHASLCSGETIVGLAKLVSLEESVYRNGGRVNYFADALAIDVLTDTTERSPTFCVPPFKRFDDDAASESWAFLFVPQDDTEAAWKSLLKREPRAVTWTEEEIADMIGEERAARQAEIVRRISLEDIHKFRIGMDGLQHREPRRGDAAMGILRAHELIRGSVGERLSAAKASGARAALVQLDLAEMREFSAGWAADLERLFVRLPESDFWLGGVMRAGVKMLLNALSTCTMVRLGRVMGNFMVYVVPSNLKLIDRATRYVSKLAGLPYEDACRLLFEVIEYVEPRMKADQAYPPVVAMAVIRASAGIGNEEAERALSEM